MKTFLANHLPWIGPSAAIVLAASGFFDRSGTEGESAFDRTVDAAMVALGEASDVLTENVQTIVAPDAANASAMAAVSAARTVPAPIPSVAPAPTPAIVATPQPKPEVEVQISDVQPVKFDPTPAPVPAPAPAAQPRANTNVASLDNPAAFFSAAQANLASQRSCIDDIKALASQSRIYFPSGGLTGEESGLTQARLLGLLAADCPGVTIQVEGHSDPSGNPAANLRLSQERAEAVITRIGASGVDTSSFVARGFGDRRPSGVNGPEGSNYYDRRVEFTVIERSRPGLFASSTTPEATWANSSCVSRLQNAVTQTKLFYTPGSVVVAPEDLRAVHGLADLAQACPQARLRVVGQHADDFGQIETPATGRLRAVALMSALVSAGYDSGEIIIAAPSYSVDIPGQPGVSNSRIDFDVILCQCRSKIPQKCRSNFPHFRDLVTSQIRGLS
jgi:outer membrane protein OmpA-like peptidoglycan-associated protein